MNVQSVKRAVIGLVLGLFASSLFGYEVAVDTVVANSGQRVAVPVRFDMVKGASYAGVKVTYDPQVLVFMKAQEGSVTKVMSDDYVVWGDEAGGAVSVTAFAKNDVPEDVGGVLTDAPEGTTLGSATAEGVTMYFADVKVAGEVEVVCEGEPLSAAAKSQIRKAMAAAGVSLTDVKRIAVNGPVGRVSIIADLGIAPSVAGAVDSHGILNVTYSMPTITITSFDPKTGVVRIKVVPGEWNKIVSEIATGYVHVYGSSNLADKMKLISKVGFDLTPYLKADTKGEAVLQIELGSHSFLRVKVEETTARE